MRQLLLFVILLLAAPFAQAQKPDDSNKSNATGLFGTWAYTVRPDEPNAEGGTFVLEQDGDQINGTFNTDAPRKMHDIELTETSLSFSFTQPEMGLIVVDFALIDGSLTGTATIGADEPLPIVAVRPEAGLTDD